jgi:hypothetical protein
MRRVSLACALLAGVLVSHETSGSVAWRARVDGAPIVPPATGRMTAPSLGAAARRVLLDAYAPVVLLAPGERALPTRVEWYLARARLERPQGPAILTASIGEPARTERLHPMPSARSGSPFPADWTVYGHAYRAADGGVLLQYWFFYAFNSFHGLGDHDADWEHVTVRIDPAGRPLGAWYARHDANAPGVWAPWDSLRREGRHPVVLSALGSHASYAHPTEVSWFDRACPSADVQQAAEQGCRVWRTWVGSTGGVADLGTRDAPGSRYLLWPGRWGADGGIADLEGGPPGPAFQPGWCSGGMPSCS